MKETTELKMIYELVISRANLLNKGYQHNQKNIYREETLQELCLGLHSMCVGTESKYFNGHTNIIYDFLIEGVKEYTKPLFSIPTHQFLFNAGSVEPKVYMDVLQIEESEFERIRYPERGTCLFRCGNERYLLQVIAPEFKQIMFGKAGGR